MPDLGDIGRDAALRLGQLALAPQTWIHRRVEQVSYLDQWTVRRRLSVDFTVPEDLPVMDGSSREPVAYLPLTQLEKRALTSFDLRDEQARSVPLLTTTQSSAISAAMLCALADVRAPSLVDPIVVKYVHRLVEAHGEDEQELALSRIFQDGTRVGAALAAHPDFVALTLELAGSFVLYLPVSAESAGRRRVVKLAFDAPKPAPKPRSVFERLGWSAVWDDFEVRLAGYCGSCHFELEAPPDMQVSAGALFATRDGAVVGDEVEAPMQRAHLNVAGVDRADGVVSVLLKARGSRLLSAAALVAIVNALALSFVTWRIRDYGRTHGFEAVSAALLVVPGALLGYVARAAEHDVLSAFLEGARVVAGVAALATFAAALMLFAGFGPSTLRSLFAVAAAVAIVCALVLATSWLRQR